MGAPQRGEINHYCSNGVGGVKALQLESKLKWRATGILLHQSVQRSSAGSVPKKNIMHSSEEAGHITC